MGRSFLVIIGSETESAPLPPSDWPIKIPICQSERDMCEAGLSLVRWNRCVNHRKFNKYITGFGRRNVTFFFLGNKLTNVCFIFIFCVERMMVIGLCFFMKSIRSRKSLTPPSRKVEIKYITIRSNTSSKENGRPIAWCL